MHRLFLKPIVRVHSYSMSLKAALNSKDQVLDMGRVSIVLALLLRHNTRVRGRPIHYLVTVDSWLWRPWRPLAPFHNGCNQTSMTAGATQGRKK